MWFDLQEPTGGANNEWKIELGTDGVGSEITKFTFFVDYDENLAIHLM